MKLKSKILVFFVGILAVLVVVLTVFSALGFRRFSLYATERHARSVAETVMVGLTESMISKTTGRRQEFLERLSAVPGVQQVRVVRGPAVVKQFGPAQRKSGRWCRSRAGDGQGSFQCRRNG